MRAVSVDRNLMQSRIREYYSTHFSPDRDFGLLYEKDLTFREFGFETPDGQFYRNMSFKSAEELHEYLIASTPASVYIGGVYRESPSRERPIHSTQWVGHELVFDIDLSDYERPCECKGPAVCSRCWTLMRTAIYFLDDTFRDDFGFSKITWCFSGRRGVHAWVGDHDVFRLSQKQRTAIVEYLSFVKGEDKESRVQARSIRTQQYGAIISNRIFRWIIRSFFEDAERKNLESAGFKSYKAREIIKERESTGVTDLLLRRALLSAGDEIYDHMIRMRFPRLDAKVTIDLRRLLRAPGSVHGNSGKICRILSRSEIETFDPTKEPSILDLK